MAGRFRKGRGSRRSREGTATVEAVIMLPTLAALLVGVLFLGRLHEQAADAHSLTRRCAWQYAASGCVEVPEGCADLIDAPSRLDDEDAQAAASALRGARSAGSSGAQEQLPLLEGALGALIGRVGIATDSREVPLVAGGTDGVTVDASFATLCNAGEFDPMDEVKRVFCNYVEICDGE